MGSMQRVEAGALRLAQGFQHRSRIGDRPRDDIAHMLGRFVGRERGAAIGDELVEVEHGPTNLAHLEHVPL
jgi:hypothetical protein